jgi:hypothetical protein
MSGVQRRTTRKPKTLTTIGWCECIGLPDLGLDHIKAKIDSGAATSSLHATRIKPFEEDGENWVEFWFRAHKGERAKRYCAPVHAKRKIKSSNGLAEFRYVIETTIIMGETRWLGHITLANRSNMAFPMLIGRRALRRGFLVNCARRYMLGRPEESDR